jgi:hypothetical protein
MLFALEPSIRYAGELDVLPFVENRQGHAALALDTTFFPDLDDRAVGFTIP